jgi:hypothetical protein
LVGVQRRAPVEIVDVGAIGFIGIISLDRGAGVISARRGASITIGPLRYTSRDVLQDPVDEDHLQDPVDEDQDRGPRRLSG